MTTAADGMFELPDTIAALPQRPFEFSPGVHEEADRVLRFSAAEIYRRLLRDQESEAVRLVARRVLHAFLSDPLTASAAQPRSELHATTESIAAYTAAARQEIAAEISCFTNAAPEIRRAVLSQRAPIGELDACWLEVLSQPATQPSVIVNRLFSQYFALEGAGDVLRSVRVLRRRKCEEAGVRLPELAAPDFLERAAARPLTALHGAFYLALARMPANFLPELVGVHYVFHALGVDELLTGAQNPIAESELRATLDAYLELAEAPERERLLAGVRLTVALEREHVALLSALAAWHASRTLEDRVAEIVSRHAPMAGKQHRRVRVGGELLAETFSAKDFDVAAFLRTFRESHLLQPSHGGDSRFVKAFKFGGPMFGIFDEHEAAIFKSWVASVQGGKRPDIVLEPCRAGDAEAERWLRALRTSEPPDVLYAEPSDWDDRELFYRLVNVENFPNTLETAAAYAERVLAESEVMFVHGAVGRYTDATYFDYTPEALYRRADEVYWQKLIEPYQPLTEIPERDEVVFLQTTYALGALIDGTWLHRMGNLGHDTRPGDAALKSIYADEMGHGGLDKNHLTLIHTALSSMGIRLPHIREAAFMEQGELPDELYGFSLYQLCLALFPDRFYNEILGYNLAIEMFGLGELRLHEVQKLRHYGFDDCYEKAHLTIDNLSAGHSKQAADIIVAHLDGVRRTVGEATVQAEWRRVWRGYAAYAYIVEHNLRKQLAAGVLPVAQAEGADTAEEHDEADLMI